jgi:hypothetical protein
MEILFLLRLDVAINFSDELSFCDLTRNFVLVGQLNEFDIYVSIIVESLTYTLQRSTVFILLKL